MIEIWKDVVGYEGLFKVSNKGRVKSLKRKCVIKDKILTPSLSQVGYLRVCLRREGRIHSKLIHQLMAVAFLGHKPNGHTMVVDHINNIKTDNRLENLQIISNRENLSKDKVGYSSKFIGVDWDKRKGKWRAQIHVNGKGTYIGSFNNELEAAEAYQNRLKQILND